MARQLSGIVVINGTDDENWPFDDEKVTRTYSVQSILDIDQPAVPLEIPYVRWGGECRVEVAIMARAVGGGEIQIEGNAKLFEGTDEDTQDLEEEKVVTFLVPRNTRKYVEPAKYDVNLSNAGFGGGDHAEIGFSFTNYIVEEE
ncbi:hypothetical protein SE17_29615 [Kouleothrix aurantiaca]|uniref:Uncharacterized protein n=1 Tax=Kouleothrix aurantiaca TaxID=186479 RepID=A0A0N8PRH9_9CHLR|nr:hypothetical protein SE17_29615 [Kouleothrix aurantiaca]